MTILNLWKLFHEQNAALSGNQLRKWCRENFLSFMRMREWQELHRQLGEMVKELNLPLNETPAEYADLHQSILTGFLGGIGVLDERREYEGARGTRFVIAPGTPLASKPPRWIVAASLMETTRLYARMVAGVEPPWIEAAGEHLIKRTYSEPHWVEERGFVAAFESTSLYGLTLSARRRVNFGNVAPREAQEIFVREALVEGRSKLRADFIANNRSLRERVERLEAKIRRRDVIVDEQALADFYLQRLPHEVNSIPTLERWLKAPVHMHGEALKMSLSDVLRRPIDDIDERNYPDFLRLEGNALPLQYRFEPTAADDGITITVPEPLVGTLDPGQLAWLVPGWREEKVTAVLRALPKSVRKSLVPVPEHAARAMAEIAEAGDFYTAMAAWISRAAGESVTGDDIARLPLPDVLRFNVRIVDLQGRQIAEGRDLTELRRTLRARSSEPNAVARQREASKHRSWDFGPLAPEESVERRGLRFTIYRRCTIAGTVWSWRKQGAPTKQRTCCARLSCGWRCSHCPNSSNMRASDSRTSASLCCWGRGSIPVDLCLTAWQSALSRNAFSVRSPSCRDQHRRFRRCSIVDGRISAQWSMDYLRRSLKC